MDDLAILTNPQSFVDLLNLVEVSASEMRAVVVAASDFREAEQAAAMMAPAQTLMSLEPEKATAIFFRMSALARLVETQNMQGWAMATVEPGQAFARPELLKAAAIYPLSVVDDEIGFDCEGLLAKALELSAARLPC